MALEVLVVTRSGHKVMRDIGSTTCVVKRSFVEAEQMTGNHELCMLIDGVLKTFPTAIVKIESEVTELSEVIGDKHEVECEIMSTQRFATSLALRE